MAKHIFNTKKGTSNKVTNKLNDFALGIGSKMGGHIASPGVMPSTRDARDSRDGKAGDASKLKSVHPTDKSLEKEVEADRYTLKAEVVPVETFFKGNKAMKSKSPRSRSKVVSSQSEVFLSSRAEGYGGGYIFNRADITSEGFKAEGYGERISLGYGASGSGPLDLSGGLNVSDIFG